MKNDIKALNNAVRKLSLKLKHDMQKQIQEPIIEMNILDEMMQQEAIRMRTHPQEYQPDEAMLRDFADILKGLAFEQDSTNEFLVNKTDHDVSDFG